MHRRLPILQGIVPTGRKQARTDILAGCTLAALGIPEVMGYTSIAGMPVVTGLYTIFIPIAVFALLGSSRHLVVGADSASAAIMAAGLAGLAATGSQEYVALAGMCAIVTGGILIVARLVKLGFIADFLSRSVLIGFLTGVGIQVAMGQVGDMFGIPAQSGGTIRKFVETVGDIAQANTATVIVSACVLGVILGCKVISPKIPGALIAVIGSIIASNALDLAADGVATVGKVQSGLPSFGIPSVTWAQFTELLPTAGAIFVVILAQSAATSRAYAARYEEQFDENVDLVGLGLANASAGLTGTFVVNGSPTKSQMVDGAGGRSQIPMITTAVVVGIVLLFFTTPLQYMPVATLASVVFLIGVELVDIAGMKRVWTARRDEFVVASITAAIVVAVGVEQAIVAAIIFSIIDHLRRSYRPNNSVFVHGPSGHPKLAPVVGGTQTDPGLVVYRFAASLYYANSNQLNEQVLELVDDVEPQVEWLVIDAAAVADVDYSGGETLKQVHSELEARAVRLVIAAASPEVRAQLDRYGITELVGGDAYFETPDDAIDAFRNPMTERGSSRRHVVTEHTHEEPMT